MVLYPPLQFSSIVNTANFDALKRYESTKVTIEPVSSGNYNGSPIMCSNVTNQVVNIQKIVLLRWINHVNIRINNSIN